MTLASLEILKACQLFVQLMTSLIMLEKLHQNFAICPSTGLYGSKILFSVYELLLASIGNTLTLDGMHDSSTVYDCD